VADLPHGWRRGRPLARLPCKRYDSAATVRRHTRHPRRRPRTD
jgi:hypothetical protein